MRDVIERMKDFDYKISSKKQAPKNIRVSYSNVIEIVFNYPLANPVTLVFSNPNGWTLQSFVNAVREGYKLIYKNRLKFGVWGHSIADLALEGFRRRGNKFFLFVGS